MSRLERLFAKPKEIEIGGEKLNISPLTVEHIDLLMDLEDKDKRANALKKIVKITLKNAVPEATDDEVNKVAIKYFKELTQAIMEVNGLNVNAKR